MDKCRRWDPEPRQPESPRPLLLISQMNRCRRFYTCQHRKHPESPRPLLLISQMNRCRRFYTCQHRKHPESPRPLAVAERHIWTSPHRPVQIGVDSATPRWRDRPSPFQSARTATATASRQQRRQHRDSNGDSIATAPHSNRNSSVHPSLGRGAPATHRRGAPHPPSHALLARADRPAPHAGQPASDDHRRTAESDARPPLSGGTERGSRCAGRPATLAPEPGERATAGSE